MLEKILYFSIEQRWLVMMLTLVLAVIGSYYYFFLPIDAVPDITNVQVQINSEALAFSPLEVEQWITFPIETVMAGLPRLKETRSLSRYGLSQVTIIFEDGTDIYFARQLINEKIQEVKSQIPEGIEPKMGPISTGLGEIFMWTLEAEAGAKKPDKTAYELDDLRTLQDWVVKPQLRNVPGVTEINTIGGYEKQYYVTPDPKKMMAYGLSFQEIIDALLQNNNNTGAGYIEHRGEQYLIRVPGQILDLEDIRLIVVGTQKGVPIRIQEIAEVGTGKELRTGAASKNGEESIVGTAFMLIGENSRTVSKSVAKKLKEINRTLPPGVKASTVYDRTELVDATINTVKKNLLEASILVIAILFLFLGNIRAAIITALIIPLSMLFTIIGMVTNKVSANLMSLGALDFGIIIDGSVIIVENCIRSLAEEQHRLGRKLELRERLNVVFSATKEVRTATMFGECIITIVYLPILTLTGVEGKMFVPMALTVITALLGAMVFSVTFVPAAVAIFLFGSISEKENILIRGSKKIYLPLLKLSIRLRFGIIFMAVLLFLFSLFIFAFWQSEFIPSLDEGDIALHAMRIPGTSLSQAIEMQKLLEKKILTFPEVECVFSKIGTAEIATDPMPPNVADTFVMLKDRQEWPNPKRLKDEVVTELAEALEQFPGNNYEYTQPIQMRFNELISGVRSDLAVKIFGEDLDKLLELGEDVAGILRKIPGASDVKVEQIAGLPVLVIHLNRKKMAKYGLNISEVQNLIEIAVGGKSAGELFEGDRRFELFVRLPEHIRKDIQQLRQLPIPVKNLNSDFQEVRLEISETDTHAVQFIPLSEIAQIDIVTGPNQISRENGKRRIVVTANIRSRDIGSFVQEAEEKIKENLILPSGYWNTWGGQFEQLLSATKRLKMVVPLALLLIFVLLFTSFGTLTDALLVLTGVPFAMTGGILFLWFRNIPLSISAGVGFIALSGVAVLNGLVMITFIHKLQEDGKPLEEAIILGAMTRLRPVLMTALVASLGFVPMAIATGSGAEVQRPLATVVIGGILTSTFLTLFVLPALYRIFHRKETLRPQS